MKILVTVSTFYPCKDGVQAVTEYLVKGLLEKGHEITLVTSKTAETSEEETWEGIKIIRVPVHTKFALYFGNKKKYQQLILKLSKNADVMINVAPQQALTDYLYPILSKIKCKKILHMHGMYDFHWHKTDFASLKAFAYKIWRHICWGYLYFVCPSKFKQYDHILQLHRFDDGYVFFKKHYGIDSVILENAANESFYCENLEQKKPYAICVANYIPRKNQTFLLEAFYKSKNSKNMELICIGSAKNSYYNYLIDFKNKLEKKYGTRKIKLLTNISKQETIQYVRDASLYLMGSIWEAFSVSLIESMAAGTPCISTDVGVARYLPGGIICNTPDDMAYWIDIFMDNPTIRTHFAQIGQNYYKQHLSISPKVELLNKLLTENHI